MPKSVVLTHRNLVASLCQLRLAERVTEDDVVLAALPLSHLFGLQAGMHLPLTQGATVVLLPRFDPGSFLAAVEDYGVTRASVVPAMMQSLLNSKRSDSFDLSSLRLLTSTGAPLAPGLARSVARRLGCRVKQGFGLTEFGGATHVAPDDGPNWPDSIGPALPGVQWRVIDPETNAEVSSGEPGELFVRSPSRMRGYLEDPEATAAAVDADGWLHTGDIVTVNDDGWFFVAGRIKELIKSGGYQDERARAAGGNELARTGSLTGTVVLVSGGDRGLGRLLAGTLGRAGATVALLARSRDELDDTVAEVERSGGKAAAVTADITDEAATTAAVAELRQTCGPIDVLINNAGVHGPTGPMWEVDPAEWWRTLEVNLRGAYTLSRIVLPHMVAAKHGRILNISNNAGTYRWPLVSAYATSKAALVKLTENLAVETKRHGVSVLSVDPGMLPFGLTAPAPGYGADPDRAARLILQLASGRGDRLSGRHFTVTDDLDKVLNEIDETERADPRTLRVRTASERRASVPERPATVPAYYLGRPAKLWLSVFRRNWSRTQGRAVERE
jgi:NAD(P)-dependent dehydrogenase (short-subunit alcohol dehydrogenase family)